MDNPKHETTEAGTAEGMSDADLGYAVLRKLREALIADPIEALMFMRDPVRVRDYVAATIMTGVAGYLFGTGVPAMRAADIADAVAEDALDNWQLRQAGGKKPRAN